MIVVDFIIKISMEGYLSNVARQKIIPAVTHYETHCEIRNERNHKKSKFLTLIITLRSLTKNVQLTVIGTKRR